MPKSWERREDAGERRRAQKFNKSIKLDPPRLAWKVEQINTLLLVVVLSNHIHFLPLGPIVFRKQQSNRFLWREIGTPLHFYLNAFAVGTVLQIRSRRCLSIRGRCNRFYGNSYIMIRLLAESDSIRILEKARFLQKRIGSFACTNFCRGRITQALINDDTSAARQ